jgi:histidinol dehydrogenase
MKVLTYPTEEAEVLIDRIVNRSLSYSVDLEHTVKEIIKAVQAEGDSALLRYTRQFDAPGIKLEELKVSDSEMKGAAKEVDPDFSALV